MILSRNNVQISGQGQRSMVFAHGFGCDQHMWEAVAPAFESDFRIVLFDHMGAGQSDLSAYDSEKYGSLDGYAQDIVEIGRELELQDAVFVGHSVSAMIGALASLQAPGMFSDLVMVGPSPRYINDEGYIGGFSREQVVTHGARDEAIRFRAATTPTSFVLSVANAGPPLDAKTRESLFQPFFRGGARPSRNGLGLGLFIVKEIAEAHGGTIEVESSAEETRFVFSMPLARPE